MIKIIILHHFSALQLHHILTLVSDEPLEDQTHTVNQDQINDFLLGHYDCRERLTVHRFSFNRVDDCSTKPHNVANKKARIDSFIRAKATTITAYQCSLSYTKQLKFVDTTLTLTITMIHKMTIRTQWLGIFLLLGMTVRVMSLISWNFSVNDLIEPFNFLNYLIS